MAVARSLARFEPLGHTIPRYKTWGQVAGYFDGDGSVTVHVGKFTLDFGLFFCDNYLPQLHQLRRFLNSHGISTGSVTKHTYEAMYIIRISDDLSLGRAASKMVPFTSKKTIELRMVLDYMRDRINGSQAIAILNQMVVERERTGKIRRVEIPYLRSEGLKIAGERAHAGARMKLPKLTVGAQDDIKGRYRSGETVDNLAAAYKVSDTTIYKALHDGFVDRRSTSS